jgi:hypothetical protein
VVEAGFVAWEAFACASFDGVEEGDVLYGQLCEIVVHSLQLAVDEDDEDVDPSCDVALEAFVRKSCEVVVGLCRLDELDVVE